MNVETPFVLLMLYCFICGTVLSLGYEALRVLRLIIPHHNAIIGIEDTVYITFCGVVLFSFCLQIGNGEFRLLFLISALAGAFVYFISIGRLINLIFKGLIKFIKHIIAIPIKYCVKLYVFIAQKASAVFMLIYQNFINSTKSSIQHLKSRHKMKYNNNIAHERNEDIAGKKPIKAKVD